MSVSAAHGGNVSRPAGSVGTGRSRPVLRAPKAPRTAHPVACTSSAAVDEHALTPAMNVQARARRLLKILGALETHASGPVTRRLIAEGLGEAATIAGDAGSMAFFLAPKVTSLAVSEKRLDWGLHGIHAFRSGRSQAGELIPLLDALTSAPGPREAARARAALAPWFQAHGDQLVRPIVLREVGAVLRAPTLLAEHKAWTVKTRQETPA